jgi:hypothetical protein
MTALQKPRNPGTSSDMLALLSLIKPMTTCALNIHESDTPKMTIVQTDIPDRTDGVLVDSICRTRSRRRASWIKPANDASGH